MIRLITHLLFLVLTNLFLFGEEECSYYNEKAHIAEIANTDGSSLFCTFDDKGRLKEVVSSTGNIHITYSYGEQGLIDVYDVILDKTLRFDPSQTSLPVPVKEPETFWQKVAGWFGLSRTYDTLSEIHETYTFRPKDYIDVDGMLISAFGEGSLGMAGYFPSVCDSGVIGNWEASSLVRITMMNGVLNLRHEFIENVQWVSKEHEDHAIHYVYRPTEGWTGDICKSLLVRYGYVTPAAERLADLWKRLLEEMGEEGLIIHYCHSIGAMESRNAHRLLDPQDRKKIRLIAFGSPGVIADDEFESILHFTSVRDGIILMDPTSYLFTLLNDTTQVHFIGSHLGIPLIDHLLSSPTYRQAIKNLAKEFIDTYGK